MPGRDKVFIQEAVVAGFNIKSIKAAREALFTNCEPDERYVYRGPKLSTKLEKANHAFETLFIKMKSLDATGKMPILACPAEDIKWLPQSRKDEHEVCSEQILKMDTEIQELKSTFHKFACDIAARVPFVEENLPSTTHHASAVPDRFRERAESTSSSKKRRLSTESYIEENLGGERNFEFPKLQRRKLARRAAKEPAPGEFSQKLSYASAAANNGIEPSVKRDKKKREGVCGKKKSDTSASLVGCPRWVPEVFLYMCKPSTEAEDVKKYLLEEELGIKEVTQASHVNSKSKSFIVSVDSFSDFQKLMSGAHIPEYVYVRRYWRPRKDGVAGSKPWSTQMQDLDTLSNQLSGDNRPAVQSLTEQMQISQDVAPQDSMPTDHSISTLITDDEQSNEHTNKNTLS